jgi:hypothetical protein
MKKALLLCLVFILCIGFLLCSPSYAKRRLLVVNSVAGGCAVNVSDDFSTNTIANYTQMEGTWSIASGVLSNSENNISVFIVESNTGNSTTTHWVYGSYPTIAWYDGVVVRSTGTDTDNFYLIYWYDGNWYVDSADDVETFSQDAGPTAGTMVNGDDVGVTVTGTDAGANLTFRIWRNPENTCPAAVDGWDNVSDTADVTFSNVDVTYAADTGSHTLTGFVGYTNTSEFDNYNTGDF